VGSHVRVLPGRCFDGFAAGDVGVVSGVDTEAQTCEVLFHCRAGGSVTVAMRHICLEAPGSALVATFRQRSRTVVAEAPPSPAHVGLRFEENVDYFSPVSETTSAAPMEDLASKVAGLEATVAAQQHALADLEARLAAREATAATATALGAAPLPRGGPAAGRLVAARVAALEGAHQAEVAELRRSLDSASALGLEHEQLRRRQLAMAQEAEQRLKVLEQQMVSLQEALQLLGRDIEGQGSVLQAQAAQAEGLQESLRAASLVAAASCRAAGTSCRPQVQETEEAAEAEEEGGEDDLAVELSGLFAQRQEIRRASVEDLKELVVSLRALALSSAPDTALDGVFVGISEGNVGTPDRILEGPTALRDRTNVLGGICVTKEDTVKMWASEGVP